MEMLDIYKNSSVYNKIKKDIDNSMVSHAYILYSDDYDLIKEYSKYISMQLMCDNDICGTCINCLKIMHNTHTDLIVYPKDDAKQILTSDILEIISSCYVSSFDGYKIYILNNFDKCQPQAQNKFLKTLEEPPQNVVFLLLTSDIKNVLKTITSRCKMINVDNLSLDNLSKIASKYKDSFGMSEKSLASIAGNLTVLNKIVSNPNYITLKADAVNIFTKMKHSKLMLNYVYALSKHKDMIEVLNELNTVVLDILKIKNGNLNISNTVYLSELQNVAETFSVKALNLIALKIKESVEKINANCNPNLVLDGLCLYILEVKTKC